ncbi:hypothetical protein [Flavobacterium sp. SM2513]|uniref:hypothetical protein n=1 Tax=Flavobacterium sp. SM2513 TaxID=3424766 RepID=UPI003D7F428E
MKTKYTDKILKFVAGTMSKEAFYKWQLKQPLLEQAEILRALKTEMEAYHKKRNSTAFDSKKFETEIDAFEDLVLTHKLSIEMLSIEKESAKTQQQKLMEDLVRMRAATLFLFIHKKAPIALLMETAEKLIATEKQFDMYDPENWKEMF